MTAEKITLVKNSWAFVITHSSMAGELFYMRLFEIAPQYRNMFREDIKVQAKKLIDMVTVIVTKLNKMDQLLFEVKGLASRHVRYGVQPEHYLPVGEALLWTLEKGLVERWSPELKEAWGEVYSKLSAAMIEAVAENHLK